MQSPCLLPPPFYKQPSKRLSRRCRRLGLVTLGGICILIFTLSYLQLKLSTSSLYSAVRDTLENFAVHPNQAPLAPLEPNIWVERARAVKDEFRLAYTAYETTAYPHDELKPLSNGTRDNLNGWGATVVDSIDTMLLMGHDDLVERSIMHVSKLHISQSGHTQFFETVIRYLGGLLSAYALTDNSIFLTHADELGMRLLPIFNTSTGLPSYAIDIRTGEGRFGWMGPLSILSEFASCQMEYRYLAHLTGRAEYALAVDRITDFLQNNAEYGGIYPLQFSVFNGAPAATHYSVGANADSAYEYLLKEWLMTGKTEKHLLDMYLRSMDAIIESMLYISPTRRLLYVTDVLRPGLDPVHDFQHLSCFLAGLFALGASTIPDIDPRHAWAAEGLAHTCWITYADTSTGLGPEKVKFPRNGTMWVDELAVWDELGRPGPTPGVREATPMMPGEDTEYAAMDPRYLLRPETIESFYILWRTTGESKWRDRGWALFESIQKNAKIGSAYASLADVRVLPASHEDDMPSYFFAETLKYAFLLCTDEELIPLNQWVFNTEAHPIPIFNWSQSETELFQLKVLQEQEGHNNIDSVE